MQEFGMPLRMMMGLTSRVAMLWSLNVLVGAGLGLWRLNEKGKASNIELEALIVLLMI
jgi:hypothetical protein